MIKGLKPNPPRGAGREASVDLSTVRVIIRCGVKGQGRQRARGRQPTPAQARSQEGVKDRRDSAAGPAWTKHITQHANVTERTAVPLRTKPALLPAFPLKEFHFISF